MTELSPEETDRVREIKQALEAEFLAAEADTPRKTAIKDIEELKGDFLDAIKHVVRHSPKDELRAKVSMWGYDKLLEQGKADVDPIRDLIMGMEAAKAQASN